MTTYCTKALSRQSQNAVVELYASIDGRPERVFVGRFAWALNELIRAGERGVTPIDTPAPRWSHYVYRPRKDGVETVNEGHGGPFSGTHARYKLASSVTVTKVIRAGEMRDAANPSHISGPLRLPPATPRYVRFPIVSDDRHVVGHEYIRIGAGLAASIRRLAEGGSLREERA